MNKLFTYMGNLVEPGLQVRIKPDPILSWRLHARPHTFVEIDHKILLYGQSPPSPDS